MVFSASLSTLRTLCTLEMIILLLLIKVNVIMFLSVFITATLKSWSLYIHGYTTRTPAISKDNRHWPASMMSSASPCEEPGGFGPFSQTGIQPVAHTLLITVCLVLWKAVILTCS